MAVRVCEKFCCSGTFLGNGFKCVFCGADGPQSYVSQLFTRDSDHVGAVYGRISSDFALCKMESHEPIVVGSVDARGSDKWCYFLLV